MRKSRGFTLIELMIVVAIIAILAAIALPAYQDYVARAQVVEGLSLATGVKTSVTSHFSQTGQYPIDNAAAGLAPPQSISGRYVRSVTVQPTGEIAILFSTSASSKIANSTVLFTPINNDGSIGWQCSGPTDRYLPSSCR